MLKCDSFRPIIKYEITPETPKLLLKNYLFFSQYKNEWEEHELWRQKYQKK